MRSAIRVFVASVVLTPAPAIGTQDWIDVVPLPPTPALGRAYRASDEVWFRHTANEGLALLPQREHLPNLPPLSYGRWRPDDPQGGAPFDAYAGSYGADGDHFRLDMVFACLVNPPGEATSYWSPEKFGPNPLHGIFELDLDADPGTGGATDCGTTAFLHGSNVGRLGGLPESPAYAGRVADHLVCPDQDPESEPRVDRSGCEFLFYLEDFGWAVDWGGEIVVERPGQPGTPAGEFGPGARWSIRVPQVCVLAPGYWFFVLTDQLTLQAARWVFDHDLTHDVTVVSFVYPLTQSGWARANGGDPANPPLPDFGYDAAYSIEEMLFILVRSADLHVNDDDPFWALIAGWEGDDPQAHLDPAAWRATGIFRTITNTPVTGEGLYAVTDAWPEVVPGDVDGSGAYDAGDLAVTAQFLAAHDGDSAYDVGPAGDGRIDVGGVPVNFLLYDLDSDGDLDSEDLAFSGCPVERFFGCSQAVADCNANGVDDACELVRAPLAGDLDGDGEVGAPDFALFLGCLGGSGVPAPPGCAPGDFDGDGDVDLDDFAHFQQAFGSVAGFANDCDGNGVLDECELTGSDCNRDGIPDACQPELDCNENGVLDVCEGSGDWDGDCTITAADLVHLPACLSGPGAPYPGGLGCIAFDADHDLDVDLEDYAWLSTRLGQPSAACLPDPDGCDGAGRARLWIHTTVEGAGAFVEPNPLFASPLELSSLALPLVYAKSTTVTLRVDTASAPGWEFLGWEIDGELAKGKGCTLLLDKEHTTAVARFRQ